MCSFIEFAVYGSNYCLKLLFLQFIYSSSRREFDFQFIYVLSFLYLPDQLDVGNPDLPSPLRVTALPRLVLHEAQK